METENDILILEKHLLGGLIHNHEAYKELALQLAPEIFVEHLHQAIIKCIRKVDFELGAMDIHLLKHELHDFRWMVGNRHYLDNLPTDVSIAQCRAYLEMIKENYKRRRLAELGEYLTANSNNPQVNIQELDNEISLVNEDIFKLTREDSVKTLGDLVRNLRLMQEDEVVATWFGPVLSRTLSHCRKGELIVIAGRPGMGKTSFGLSQCLHVAVNENTPVLIISYDSSATAFARKMLMQFGQLTSNELQKSPVDENTWYKINKAEQGLSNTNIYLANHAEYTVIELRNLIKRYKQIYDVSFVFIDYLQLIPSHRRMNIREQEISFISRELKRLARDLEIAVMVSSQLSRAADRRSNMGIPMLSDLRDSGCIEQDADKVLMLFRPEYYGMTEFEDGSSTHGKAELFIAKNRNGPLDKVPLNFIHEYTRFTEDKTRYHFNDKLQELWMPENRADEFDSFTPF